MKIAQYEGHQGLCIGVEVDNEWLDYTKAVSIHSHVHDNFIIKPPATIMQMLAAEGMDIVKVRTVIDFVKKHKLTKTVRLPADAKMRAPIMRPGKIVALGLNYVLHAKEGSFQVPEEPILFVKVGSSVIGPDEVIRIPQKLGRMDHEIELGVVIGKMATEVKKADAYDYVAGYCVVNDVSARDLQTKDLEKRHPWFRSKSFDSFTPMGPWIVTKDEIKNPHNLKISCDVNRKTKQSSNTKNMVFDIPTQIEFITKYITLEPGDVISTGTPEGIGPIEHGDEVSCHVEKIGTLKNPVRKR